MENFKENNFDEQYIYKNIDISEKKKINNEYESQDRWDPSDGYRWMRQNGVFVPADENWQPLDLSPLPTTQAPWPGDFCYLSQHLDCQLPECNDIPRQLVFVDCVEKELGFANVMLVSDQIDMAMSQEVILNPTETKIPFDVVIEQVCGPVFFDQLSAPVGCVEQDIIDRLVENTISGNLDFPAEKKGRPLFDTKDPRWKYGQKRLEIMQRLYCYCLNKMLFEDDLAAEAEASENQPQYVFDEDDTEFIEGFPDEVDE